MTRRALRLAGATILAAGAFALPATTATAASIDDAMGSFMVKLTPEDGAAIEVQLSCYPDGGSHPNATGACADLAEAEGDVRDIPPDNGACPRIYTPVTATLIGTWQGEERFYEALFANDCEAARNTGGDVFKLA
ncbi:MAG: SSI family serine proteinase inhibitor [Stackebrandtia sp.]